MGDSKWHPVRGTEDAGKTKRPHHILTPQTDHIVNKDTLALTKPGVMLINVSRGRLIHTRALIAALKSGHMGGVALDVYEEEEGIFFVTSLRRGLAR